MSKLCLKYSKNNKDILLVFYVLFESNTFIITFYEVLIF